MSRLDSLSTSLLNAEEAVTPTTETLERTLQSQNISSSLARQSFTDQSLGQRLANARGSRYPLFCLAKPLLAILSEIPGRIEQAESVEVLRSWLIYEISLFAQLCEQLDIPWRKMTIARYCFCTALDEAIHTTEWGIASGWAQQNLLNYFEEDNDGGNKFFLLAGRLAMNPSEYAEVLMIMLHCLNLGFAGRYSIQPEGQQQLTQIRQQLYTLLLPYIRDNEGKVITPYTRLALPSVRRSRLPLRACVTLAFLVIGLGFGAYQLQLSFRLAQLTDTVTQFSHSLSLPVVRQKVVTLPILLKSDIEQGRLTIEDVKQGYLVKVMGNPMFASGSAMLATEHRALIERLAQATQQLGGRVRLIGHSDNQPIKTQKKLSNQQLSLQRAENVAQLFHALGFMDNQLEIVGVGEQQPLSGKRGIEQRSQNRRVEFVITI